MERGGEGNFGMANLDIVFVAVENYERGNSPLID
jgi:hypothetical protein